MVFRRFKEQHAGQGPFQMAYGALFPEGILGRRGLAGERERTNSLIASIEADDELAGLAPLLEAGRSPLTREQHAAFRGAVSQAAADQKTLAGAYDAFHGEQRRLLEQNPADSEQLGAMSTQMDIAHGYLTSGNPELQKIGAQLAGKVYEAQQTYTTTNEAQRIAMGEEKWSRFQQVADDLRTESAPYMQQVRAWSSVNAALQENSAAGDLALVYGVMHVIEPGSAVQSGELANASNAAGVPDIAITAYNRLLRGGERLTPDERRQFYTLARNIMGDANSQQLERNSRAIAAGRAGDIGETYLEQLQAPIAPLGEQRSSFGTQPSPLQPGSGRTGALAEREQEIMKDLTDPGVLGFFTTPDPRFAGAEDMPFPERLQRLWNDDLQRREGETPEAYNERLEARRQAIRNPPRTPGRTHVSGVIQRPTND